MLAIGSAEVIRLLTRSQPILEHTFPLILKIPF